MRAVRVATLTVAAVAAAGSIAAVCLQISFLASTRLHSVLIVLDEVVDIIVELRVSLGDMAAVAILLVQGFVSAQLGFG
jgi:hypothetical protein